MDDGRGFTYVSYSQAPQTTLLSDLLLAPITEVSARYKLLSQVSMPTNQPNRPLPYMRLFEVMRPQASPVSKVAQSAALGDSRQ
jgi:hypothetical protein